MQLEVSAETAAKVHEVRRAGHFRSDDDVIAFAMDLVGGNNLLPGETDAAVLDRLLDEGRRDIEEGRFTEVGSVEQGYAIVEAMMARRRGSATNAPTE